MAHKEQREFFEKLTTSFPMQFLSAFRVFEVGSQNINGSVRDYFPNAHEYLGIDLGMAPDVDWVVPGELAELSDCWADIVVSTECFEHCENWQLVFLNMTRILKFGGLFIFTCAGIGRAAHGTIDSDEFSSPFTTSYYKNLDVDQVVDKIKLGAFFDTHGFEMNAKSGDLYFWGVRSQTAFVEIEHHWSSPLDRLARAQGQLAQAVSRHQAISAEAYQARADADRARVEAFQAKEEAKAEREAAYRERVEADQARADLEVFRAEVNSLRAEILRISEQLIQANATALAAELKTQSIVESTTWRLSRPLRKVKDCILRTSTS
jgi:SAM-dependent methyltransferase